MYVCMYVCLHVCMYRECVVTMRRQRQRQTSDPSCGCPVYIYINMYTHIIGIESMHDIPEAMGDGPFNSTVLRWTLGAPRPSLIDLERLAGCGRIGWVDH